jgi:hypothetical protein
MDLNVCTLKILRYLFFVLILCIHKSYFHGHNKHKMRKDDSHQSLVTSIMQKNNPETEEETEQHSTNGYLSYQSSDSIDSDDSSTKTISADNGASTQTMEPSSTQATPLNTSQKKSQTTSTPSKMLT